MTESYELLKELRQALVKSLTNLLQAQEALNRVNEVIDLKATVRESDLVARGDKAVVDLKELRRLQAVEKEYIELWKQAPAGPARSEPVETNILDKSLRQILYPSAGLITPASGDPDEEDPDE